MSDRCRASEAPWIAILILGFLAWCVLGFMLNRAYVKLEEIQEDGICLEKEVSEDVQDNR